MSRPSPSSKNFSASNPIHFSETFAADSVRPFLTIAGKATPSGMSLSLISRTDSTFCEPAVEEIDLIRAHRLVHLVQEHELRPGEQQACDF